MFATNKILETRLLEILAEDVGQGDATVAAIIPAETIVEAEIVAHEDGIAAGIEEIAVLAKSLDLDLEANVTDGDIFKTKQAIIRLTGNARTVLTAERTILNLLSRMSGIATATKKLTEKIKEAKLPTRIAATRKTAPGLLFFDKKAVQIGGGDPHRLHLDDLILVKDNHIAIVGSVEEAVKKARANVSFTKKIEVEVKKPEEAAKAAKAGADIIMLDNFTPEQTRQTIELLKKQGHIRNVILESSGGLTAENILEYASTGVNVLSLGEITHSVKSIDLSLDITKVI
jgi:nicotinate-nucleotide pyrophosphorylase (carboxylating)